MNRLNFDIGGNVVPHVLDQPENLYWPYATFTRGGIIYQHGSSARTENTIPDPDILFEELDLIEDQGYALNNKEEFRSARVIGAPIFCPVKEVIAVVSVRGPSGGINDDRSHDEFTDPFYETANMIGADLEIEGCPIVADSRIHS